MKYSFNGVYGEEPAFYRLLLVNYLYEWRMSKERGPEFAAEKQLHINIVTPETFPINLWHQKRQGPMALHTHDVCELVVVIAGTGNHVTKAGSTLIQAGTVFVIPPGVSHGYGSGNLEIVNIQYDATRLELPLGHLTSIKGYQYLLLQEDTSVPNGFAGHLQVPLEKLSLLDPWLKDLEHEIKTKQPGWEAAAGGILIRILVQLARAYSEHDENLAQQYLRLDSLQKWILEHLHQDLPISTLARRLGVSNAQLERLWRQAHKQSVRTWIEARRLELANVLLLRGDLKIHAVAQRTGFTSPEYLARRFKKHYGKNPRKVRSKKK